MEAQNEPICFNILLPEILDLICNLLNLKDIYNLASTSKTSYNIQFPIVNIIKSIEIKFTLPKFLLQEKWANLLYSQDPKFKLPNNAIIHIPYYNTLIPELIFGNSLNVMKLLINYKYNLMNISGVVSTVIIKILKNHDYFSDFEFYHKYYGINQILLVLTYLYGTKEMLLLLLKSDNIKNINNHRIIHNFLDKETKSDLESLNLLNFIDHFELKNNWNTRHKVCKRISFDVIFVELIKGDFNAVKNILNILGKFRFDLTVTDDIINRIYAISDLSKKKLKLLKYNSTIKIKHLLIFITILSETVYKKFINIFNPNLTLKYIYDFFEWDFNEIGLIKEFDEKFGFDICGRLFN
jgi:hypothetical protein